MDEPIPGLEEDQGRPMIWEQPLGGRDVYAVGDHVPHHGKVWKNTAGGNVWESGAYGWIEVIT